MSMKVMRQFRVNALEMKGNVFGKVYYVKKVSAILFPKNFWVFAHP